MMNENAVHQSRAVFLRKLIGRPYVPGATGPDAFDCFGLVAHVSSTLFDRTIPSQGEFLAARRLFRAAIIPVDGAVALMRAGDRHVGIWLAEGGILHAVEGKGVVFDDAFSLSLTGFGRPRYFNPR